MEIQIREVMDKAELKPGHVLYKMRVEGSESGYCHVGGMLTRNLVVHHTFGCSDDSIEFSISHWHSGRRVIHGFDRASDALEAVAWYYWQLGDKEDPFSAEVWAKLSYDHGKLSRNRTARACYRFLQAYRDICAWKATEEGVGVKFWKDRAYAVELLKKINTKHEHEGTIIL